MATFTIEEDVMYRQALEAYSERIASLDAVEKREYFREDYSPDDFLYVEYLDYLDQWEHDFHIMFPHIVDSFIHKVVVRYNMEIKCGDHNHVFYDTPPTETQHNETIVLPDTDYSDTCWYNIISANLRNFSGLVSTPPRLPEPLERFLHQIAKVGMWSRGKDLEKCTFETFQKVWFGKLDTCPTQQDQTIFSIAKEIRENLKVTAKPDCYTPVYDIESIYQDHGFHAFIAKNPEPQAVINSMNKLRRKAGEKKMLRLDVLTHYVKECGHCNYIPGQMSPPAIYYAPPGAGKSTALRYHNIIALDTDWLIRPLTEDDLKEFILRREPILTNQYQICSRASYPVIGLWPQEDIHRRDSAGHRYTTEAEMEKAEASMRPYFPLLKGTTYLTRNYFKMFLHVFYQYELISRFLHDKPRLLRGIPVAGKGKILKHIGAIT